MKTLSYVLSVAGLLCMIAASLVKGKKMETILAFVFFGNALVATSYLIGGSGLNGAASCYIGAAQTLINYFFDRKRKPLPAWLIALYAIAIVVCNLLVGGFTALGLLAIVATLTFILCIGQKDGARYRFWTVVNMVLWCLFDVLSQSYNALITHVTLLVFTLVGMILHDRKQGSATLHNP